MMIWCCDGCGHVCESDPVASDDFDGQEVGIGPNCEACGDENDASMDFVCEKKNGVTSNCDCDWCMEKRKQ